MKFKIGDIVTFTQGEGYFEIIGSKEKPFKHDNGSKIYPNPGTDLIIRSMHPRSDGEEDFYPINHVIIGQLTLIDN